MVELRHLRYFVAVAQAGHVGRAAERLAISQPPLSRQVRELEEQLGVALFSRERRRLKLTHAGAELLVRAEALLAQAAEFEQSAARASQGVEGRLTLGCVEGALQAGVVQADLTALAAVAPKLVVELRALRSQAIIDGVRRGELDVGYTYATPADDHLATTLRHETPYVLALPRGHALTRVRALSPRHLDGLPFVGLSSTTQSAARVAFLAACQAAGFTPDVRLEAVELSSVLSLVGAGLGLAIVGEGSQRVGVSGVSFRALPWLPLRLRVHQVWSRRPASAAARRFVALTQRA